MTHAPPGHIRIRKLKNRAGALLLSFLLTAAMVLSAFHHHADEQDHPDCSICAVAHHHSADTAVAHRVLLSLPVEFPTLFTSAVPTAPAAKAPLLPHNRAPPA
ncbi:hypothetical protein [Geobacter sp. SVR]|uniref:hypothetical protein n=1 Tax=Geobacter sp. SVR TaxID=2495594 RepID=UPI00143EF96F|nr:hypothetical protein [Geobacter sp. SVR]BCS53213.1 hypothetical protein GSVR_15210 [Geobacter sp. SVR]GCF84598.1 hypothetical protein GSbR_11980 [Geobacter sp. SVR]